MRLARLALAALLAPLAACTTGTPPPPASTARAPVAARQPVTILISIDGFRADYLDRGVTPTLSALAAGGLSASMRPSFPSKTFPNHWTLVTGLVPDHHGITSNNMEDPAKPGVKFTMTTDDPWWWNTATPLWVDAEKAGIRSATVFWPGSNVAVGGTKKKDVFDYIDGGTRPEDWFEFNIVVPSAQRVDMLLDLMRRPAANRPKFLTAYFDTIDTAGHRFGPDGTETTQALGALDAELGRLVQEMKALGQPANFVIVADHGMAPIAMTRVVKVSDLVDPADVRTFETGPFASFYPLAGHEAAAEKRLLAPHAHAQCWRKSEIPARFRYGTNVRIPPVFCLAETDWMIVDKDFEEKGNHGYDNQSPEMRALFIANGPAFPKPVKLAPFDNVDVAPLLRDLLGLPPKAGDGDDAPFRGLVRP